MKLEKFFYGRVKLEISGEQLERFLNLCKARDLLPEKIKSRTKKCLEFWMPLKDFRKLQPIRRKTKVKIHILEKRGLPFILQKGITHKCFLTGILICIVLIIWLSGHIWNIHIEGNTMNSTPEILRFLDEQGVIHGIRRKNVNCAQIAAALRKEYPEITFVSAKVEGTRLLLEIQEENQVKEELEKEQISPCDLVANIEGEIVNLVIRNGVPNIKTGDICKTGDVLISGTLEILNDSQEVVRTEYVAADADIYVRHEVAYYKELSLSYKEKRTAGKGKTSWYLHMGNWIAGADFLPKENYTTSVQEFPWQITENFILPISIGAITRVPYKLEECFYTKEQAEEKLIEQLQIYEKELLQKEIRIETSSLSMKMEEKSCALKGTLTVIEKCGVQKAITEENRKEISNVE